MELSNDLIRAYTKRIFLSRLRLLSGHGFYGLLLMHADFMIDDHIETAATDGKKIIFNPTFLEKLSDSELDFILMHEVLHMALRHTLRSEMRNQKLFNIACDIVVNSNILKSNDMNITSITVNGYGVSMHLTPGNKEGFLFTAEQVYEMLLQGKNDEEMYLSFDDHSAWGVIETTDPGAAKDLEELWDRHLLDAAAAVSSRKNMDGHSDIPAMVLRRLEELRKPKLDWRSLLIDFIQEETVDYSFTPPDRRFFDSPFFLPDFNEKEEMLNNILFMIDSSGSVTDREMSVAYSEVKGAIDQLNGHLRGWIGFFDHKIKTPVPFETVEDFMQIKPKGGGGTSFRNIFDYVIRQMNDNLPTCIIVLTDGDADYPDESVTNGIPVLWLINNDKRTPPWGRIGRIEV